MKNFKIQQQSSGFMLMEAAIAIAIMAILLTPVLVLQQNVFKRVIINMRKIEYSLPIKAFFSTINIDPLPEGQTQKEQSLKDPAMEIEYEKKRVESPVLSRFKDLFIEKVTGRWDEWAGQKENSMKKLIFIPSNPEAKVK